MNHPFRSLWLIAMLGWLGLAHTDAFAQQPPPPAPAEPSPPVDIQLEVERSQDAADEAMRKAQRVIEWQGRHPDNVLLHIGDDSKLLTGEAAAAVISVFGSAEAAGDVYEAVIAIGGNARTTGSVGEAVIAVLGDAYVDGKVGEGVIALMGNVELGPNARVANVVSVGGTITRDPDAVVTGTQQQIAFGSDFGEMQGLRAWLKECFLYGRPLAFDSDVRWAWWLAFGFLALYVMIALLFDGTVQRCVDTLERRPAQTALAAILTVLLSPVMVVVLAITVIGIPLIPFFVIGLFCAALFGKAVVLGALGRRITRFTGIGPFSHVAFAVLLGGLIVSLIYTVPVLGFIAFTVLGFIGLGAVAYTLIIALRPRNEVAAAPAGAPAAAPMSPDAPIGGFTESNAAPPVSPAPPRASPADPTNLELATLPRADFVVRMVALFIDAVLIAILVNWIDHLMLVALAGYGALMWKLKGATIGGIIFQLRVVRTDGRDIEWETAIVRALSCFLSLVPAGLGFFWILFDRNRQAWHDKIAGTVVVRVPKHQGL